MAVVSSEQLHATTVAIRGRGVVIEGRSGAGKSDLALRLIDRGAVLVADDTTILRRDGERLVAGVPETIAGRIEVRGIGIVDMAVAADVPVALFVRLADAIERMPELGDRRVAGLAVREVAVDPRECSAPIKVELALEQVR